MRTTRPVLAAALAGLVLVALPGLAQLRVQPLSDQGGQIGLGLLLRRLSTVGVFMQATAHPDDEYNAQLVMYARGMGYRTILATATRGDGGQNEIGPEIFDALAVLRTEELEAMHRFDGTEQYFTRAVDFGFTVSLEETLQKWGKDETTGDYVRLIRMLRPDVITGMAPTATGLNHQHHPASALLSRDAYLAANDPSRYPEQLREGLRPWQAKKYYFTAGGPGGGGGAQAPAAPAAGFCQVETAIFDSLLGRTYAEIGSEARSMHKCQGTAQLLALPGPAARRYQLIESMIPGEMTKVEQSLFDGIDTSIGGLVQYVKGRPPQSLVDGLAAISKAVQDAQARFTSSGPEAAAPALASGLSAVRALRGQLAGIGLDEAARYEIDTRLQPKEEDFQQALLLADDMRIETLANDGVVIGGQPVNVTVISAVHAKVPVSVNGVTFSGFEGAGVCKPGPIVNGLSRCESPLTIPMGAKITAPYWTRPPNSARYEFESGARFGLPFQPTPFRARIDLELNGAAVSIDRPVEYRYESDIFSGEKRMELQVVPALAVKLAPEIVIIPSGAGTATGADREIRVTVTNGARSQTTGQVRLELPTGWRSQPEAVPLTFAREDEAQTARFMIRAPVKTAPGAYRIRAIAGSGGRTFDHGYQVVEYSHTRRRHLDIPADATLKVVDVKTAPNLTVGYIMGTGDEVPVAIAQLGAKVSLIDSDELAWGDLAKYNTIVLGVRAYEKRDDLRAHNNRLLDYVERGGTLIVQYNREGEFNRVQYTPFPVKVTANRVTDENAPVTLLVPKHPAFTYPNLITDATWKGWVQERGTYFLDRGDPRYVDLLEMDEPFANNKGLKRGALVEARVGKGRWIYLGLGIWRQLPAGTEGAYQLLANLISLGKAPASAQPAAARRQ